MLNMKKRKPKSRGNGQGSAYQRPGQRTWTASVTIDWRFPSDPSKPRIPIKRTKGGFATKKEALAYCPVLLAGGVDPKREAPRLSFYWDVYKDNDMKNISAGKQSAYKTAWNKLKRIHDIRVDRLTVDSLRTAVSESCKTYDTAKDCKNILSNLFKLAAADRFAQRDLPSYIILPEKKETERIPFSDEEQKKIWKRYDDGDLRAAIPLLMIYTGMMPGEAMGLKVENINLEDRIIIHSGLKTKVRRQTPIVIADSIVPVVKDLIDNAQPSGYIWKRNEDEWYETYYAVLNDAGCRRLTPYSCRHTTATALAVDQNIAPQTIRKVMRWTTTKMLDRYAHPQVSDALDAVNTLKKP